MTIQVPQKRIRFAIYTRYSSEMQNELSLEAQEQSCREAIAKRKGVVIDVYSDSAKSGWSLERNGFNELRRNAEKKKFDAIMFWKFDRLARNHDHAIMIKILLRSEYNLKLYCVEGFSEDEDNSPYTAMMEQMLGIFSAFYSKNLSNETKRGKRQRAIRGEFNGSIPPFGYDLVRKDKATESRPYGLHVNPKQAKVVEEAFLRYSSGKESDTTIAHWMNEQPVVQQIRQGKKPIGKGMVRDMLQNRTYTGHVSYVETLYRGSLGQGRRSGRNRRQWFEGKHEAIISDELLERCVVIRKGLARLSRVPQTVRTYSLHDRVYCARCIERKPQGLEDTNYGKMRPAWDGRYKRGRYRCIAKDRGYIHCGQSYIPTDSVDEQVVSALSVLVIPTGLQERVKEAVKSRVEHAKAYERMGEIEEIVKRIDFSWEQGFLTPPEYIAKRQELQGELEALRPIDYDKLVEAADLITNFGSYWRKCEDAGNPTEARKQLLAKIVDRVYVYSDKVIGITLYGNYGIVLDDVIAMPYDVREKIRAETKMGASKLYLERTHDENDGI